MTDVPVLGWANIVDLAFLLRRDMLDHWKIEDTWRASSLGMCMRRQTLERRGVPHTSPIDAKTARIFRMGDLAHKDVRSIYWQAGLAVAQEVEASIPELHVVGHMDLIARPVPDMEMAWYKNRASEFSPEWLAYIRALREKITTEMDGQLGEGNVGIEIKSISSFGFKNLDKYGPNEHHKVQLGCYALAHRIHPEQFPEPVARWELQYVSKDDMHEARFGLVSRWIDSAERRLTELNTYWEAGDLPPCECTGTWMQKYCSYRTQTGECCEV